MRAAVILSLKFLLGGLVIKWLDQQEVSGVVIVFAALVIGLVIVVDAFGFNRLRVWSGGTTGRRLMGAALAFLVVGGLAAFGWYALTANPSPPDAPHLNAVMHWDRFQEVEGSQSGWGLRAWIDVTSRADKPMVLSFHFRLTDETRPPSFQRFFKARLDGTDTNTVEIPPFGHKSLVLDIASETLHPEPVDMGDAQRKYWLDVEDRVSGLKATLQPGQRYEAGAPTIQEVVPPVRIEGRRPAVEPSPSATLPTAPEPAARGIKEPDVSKNEKTTPQSSSGSTSPNVTQGPGSIAQFGSNNQATINHALPPWVLAPEQRSAIASVLRAHSQVWQKDQDMVSAVAGDPDSTRMADSFIAAMREAGWDVKGYSQSFYSQVPDGIFIAISEADKENPTVLSFLNAMAATLSRIGVISGPLDVNLQPGLAAGRVEIRIGRRPIR